MAFDTLRWIVQYLHVLSGILWIGGGCYTLLVQIPAVASAPPAARGPVMAELAPRQIRYILRVAELTLATGILNALVSGRLSDLGATLGTLWGWSIGLGFVLTVALYVSFQALSKPAIHALLAAGRRAAAGEAAAGADVPAFVARLRRIGAGQLVVGALIVLLMVTAHFAA